MPLPRIKIQIQHATASVLTTAQTTIESKLNRAKEFDRTADWVSGTTLSKAGVRQPYRVLEARLLAKVDADTIWSDVKSLVAALRLQGVSGRILYHQCSHNDARVTPCVAEVVDF